jgi:hypothetical protein
LSRSSGLGEFFHEETHQLDVQRLVTAHHEMAKGDNAPAKKSSVKIACPRFSLFNFTFLLH